MYDWSSFYVLMMLPGLMVLSALCLFAMLGINPKMLLVICIAWPALTAAVAGIFIYLSYLFVEAVQADDRVKVSKKQLVKDFEDQGFYLLYIIPGSAAMHIILAIYCIVLLVCLACCQRGGAGRDEDLYSLEENEEGDGIESSTKSHISIE
ncbi:hypothetical protein GCK72_002675 [Caenorhabditis remanei]|uniref:Uncharacterized protein n=1 Tax=Caenorhabditis remanei TaxID=31234 RepID=A0A6A5HUL5_CAERE|nr:hypothetical protein GCK72_002675 [Caenorhabditis remanei]KAF1770851.1 hypothetical protein GCK72_002675 [Caenorhabditis remanei]